MICESINVTVLVENSTICEDLETEHGLSFWISTDYGNILWDTGQTDALVKNARMLGIALNTATHVVLSHGHYDHTGGLPKILALAPHVNVYGHPGLFDQRFALYERTQIPVKSICSRIGKESVEKLCNSLLLSSEPAEILPGIFTTGEIPRNSILENSRKDFYLDTSCTVHDPILDDQALYMESSEGIIVILGCAHSGAVNTLDYVSELTNYQDIFAVFGGMHLFGASKERLEATADAFNSHKVQMIGPCHCIGKKAKSFFRMRFPKQFTECATGSVFSFGRKNI